MMPNPLFAAAARIALGLACASFAAAAAPAGAEPAAAPRPVNVVIMIPDGCGLASLELARLAGGRPLSLDSIRVGTVSTWSADSRVTDSAAAATAYATGVKTRNRVVSLDPDGRTLTTLMEAAARRGMATGLIVKSRITDATPAAFTTHARQRRQEASIALQEIEHRVDVMMGGGLDQFVPSSRGGSRADGRDLLAEAERHGYQVVRSRAEFDGPLRTPLLALFATANLPYDIDRDRAWVPSLVEMTRKGLALLSQSPHGFVVMIEGSRIDHAGHENDPATQIREVFEFDAAVREVLEFARRDGRTLVVSAADHETGGLSLGDRSGGRPAANRLRALLAVKCSAEQMSDSIRAGISPDVVFERNTGMRLSPEDARRISGWSRDLTVPIGRIESSNVGLQWSTTGHTGVDVGLFAFGPCRDRFVGALDNTDVGSRIAECLGLQIGRPRKGR